jgi:hypothetical protein
MDRQGSRQGGGGGGRHRLFKQLNFCSKTFTVTM